MFMHKMKKSYYRFNLRYVTFAQANSITGAGASFPIQFMRSGHLYMRKKLGIKLIINPSVRVADNSKLLQNG